MSRLRSLIQEIHRRSLWQVLGIYLGGAWVALQGIEALVSVLGLPEWVPGSALVLLIVGLPIVLATAFVREGAGDEETSDEADAPSGKGVRRLWIALTTTAAVLVLLAIAAWMTWPRPLGLLIDLAGVSGPPVEPALPDKPSIVVLPFENLSGDPEQEYFSDGITEQITADLARNPLLFVISRNSAFTYKGRAVKVEEVGRELGVRYVVEGSVRRADDRVRVTAQLIDATSGAHVWAEAYDRKLEDIFAIQDEITIAIAAAMGAKLTAAEVERTAQEQAQNLTAYDLLMRGQWCSAQALMEGNPRARVAEARSFFERAIEINPRSAPAFAWLAITHYADRFGHAESFAQSLGELERAARKSVSLDPELPLAHLVLSYVHQLWGEPNEALAAVRHAIELDPSFAWAYRQIGFYLGETGEPEEAIAVLEKGMRLSPRDPWLSESLRAQARAHFAAQRYQEAVECAKQSIERGWSPAGSCWLDLAASLAHLGRTEEAAAALRQAEAWFGSTSTVAELRRAFFYVDPDSLDRWLDGLRKAGLPE
jgi:adenylate cyclase